MYGASKTRINWTELIAALALLCSLSSFGAMAQTVSDKPLDAKSPTVLVEELKGKVTTQQRETIEQVVREYLLSHPTVIREAMQALQAQEEKDKQERVANSLKTLESDIYSDPDSPVAGNPKGDVTIVVFFDYNCGYCKSTLPTLQTLLSKDQSIKLVYKELPILGPQSRVAAQVALAANRQGKYDAFSRALLASDRASDDAIKNISDRLGLNFATLQQDMADPKLNEALDRNLRLASTLDINGTPAFIVGQQVIPGAVDMDSLAKVVSAERARLVKAKTAKNNSEPMKTETDKRRKR